MIEIQWADTPIAVTIDMTRLTWGDVVAIQRAQAGSEADAQATLEAIVTKVTGTPAQDLPAQAFTAVVEAMMQRATGGDTAKN